MKFFKKKALDKKLRFYLKIMAYVLIAISLCFLVCEFTVFQDPIDHPHPHPKDAFNFFILFALFASVSVLCFLQARKKK